MAVLHVFLHQIETVDDMMMLGRHWVPPVARRNSVWMTSNFENVKVGLLKSDQLEASTLVSIPNLVQWLGATLKAGKV